MQRLLISISLFLLAVAVPQRVFSQSADTSDLFLNAYMANEQGEKLESSGDSGKALSKYRYAASLLDQISHDDPNWQPIVVDYRKKRVSENIARLQQQIGAQAAPSGSSSTAIEGELPQKDNNPSSDMTGSPEPSSPPTAASANNNGFTHQVRDQLDQLQNDLRESQQKLKSVENEKEELAGRLNDALKQLDRTKVSEAELKGQLKQAQDAYQNSLSDHSQTAGSQKEIQARIFQLENALKDAEADREAADEQNDEYARRATKARQATAAIAQQRDEANAQVKAVESKYSAASKLASQLDTARKQIASLTKDRDDATQRVDDLDKQLASASKTAAKLTDAQKQIAALKAAQDQAAEKDNSQLDAARKQIVSLTKDRDAATQRVDDLNKQFASTSKTAARLADAQKQIAALKAAQEQTAEKDSDISGKLADARKQIDQLTGERDTTRQQVTALNDKLANAQKQVVSVKADRDQIAMQRDQALADLGKAREAQKHVEQLMAENVSLTRNLAADEKTIHDFKSGSPENGKQIADLRKQVSDTKALLTTAQQDRDNLQATLNDLQQQYDGTTAELAELKANNGVNAEEKKTLTDENDLLRGIVLRQLKEQARRDQARRLVMSELSQLQIQSDTLLKQIDYLGQPVVQLTDKEKALFKDPSIDIPDPDDSTMAISIAAPKQNSAAHESLPAPAPVESAPSPKASASAAGNLPEGSPAPVAASSSPSATPMELASLTSSGFPKSAPSPASSAPASTPAAETPDSTGTTNNSSAAAASTPMVPPELADDARAAKEAFERTEYREAEKIYEKMLTSAPTNVYILSNLGVVYFRNQKWKLAEESLKKAIAVAPEDTFSWCTLGIVYYQEKRYDDAINSLTRALTINPKYAVAHNYLGITASQKGWQEAALKELETAIEYDPNYGDAYFNLAVVYAMQQPPNKEMARKYYRRATDLGAEPDAGLEQLVK